MLTTMAEGARGVRLLDTDHLGPGSRVRCFVTERHGGVSPAPYHSLNLAYHVGDDPRHVAENRRRASEAAGIDAADWVVGQQVHGSGVRRVTAADRGRGAASHASSLPGTDGLVTDAIETPLIVLLADCAAVWLFDTRVGAVGLAHAGWRGAADHVARRTVEAMTGAFATRPADVRAVIGPSIGPEDYVVGTEVITAYRHAYPAEWPLLMRVGADGATRLDLWQANAVDLQSAGVVRERIHTMGISTASRTDLFFSHRAEGETGRFVACAWLPGMGR
jgi:hypothetical protein